MTTNAKVRLIQASMDLRTRVHASLPWGFRLGSVLLQVKFAAESEDFGKLVFGVFLLSEVEGMPSTSVVPESLRDIDRLPSGYGRDFGVAARRVARKFFSDESVIDDLLSTVGLKVLSDPKFRSTIRGKPLSEARSYVYRMIANQARDMLRAQKVRRHELLDDVVADPASWDTLEELIPESEKAAIRTELEESVAPWMLPDLPLYFDLLLDGYSNKEIAEKRLLPSLQHRPVSQQALAKYRAKMKEVLQRHFDVQAQILLAG